MGKNLKTTILIKDGNSYYRLAKIFFGSDGSYYATLPYHTSGLAYLFKATVNYDTEADCKISWSDLLETGLVEEERIKLSHHPDGFVQFSGPGVFSGKNEDGSIRGMGVMSSPLNNIFDGPSFAYSIQDIADLDLVNQVPSNSLTLDLDEYFTIENTRSLIVEAHYFSPFWRRFIRYDHLSRPIIRILHPCKAILELRVFAASMHCDFPGFLGFEVYRHMLSLPQNGYSFAAPTGNMRLNANKQRLGDAIFCIYPRSEKMPVDRSLNFPQRPVT